MVCLFSGVVIILLLFIRINFFLHKKNKCCAIRQIQKKTYNLLQRDALVKR